MARLTWDELRSLLPDPDKEAQERLALRAENASNGATSRKGLRGRLMLLRIWCYLLTGGAHEWIWLGKPGFPDCAPGATGDTFECRHCHRREEFPIRCIGPDLWDAYWEDDS